MTSDLIRREVLSARRVQWLGTIRIGRPLSFAVVTGVSCLLAAGLVAFAVMGQVTRKAKLPGLLVPLQGTLNLVAPQAGVLVELRVKEGDLVTAGQAVAVISSDRGTQNGDLGMLISRTLADRRASLDSERQLIQRQACQESA